MSQLAADELGQPIVVRFGDSTARTTAETMGARLGLRVQQVDDTVRELVECGFLTELEDGSYAADMSSGAAQ